MFYWATILTMGRPVELEQHGVPIVINVYRISNIILHKMGIRIYHSAVEICGKEWSFGGSAIPDDSFAHLRSGIFWIPPKENKEDLLHELKVGTTPLSRYVSSIGLIIASGQHAVIARGYR